MSTSTTSTVTVSVAELRRRVRANQALQAKTRELAAANVLSARDAAAKAVLAQEKAQIAAREAVAASLRLFDGDTQLVSELLGVPAEELEREAKPVTAARAKEVIDALRTRAARPRAHRPRSSRSSDSQPEVTANGRREADGASRDGHVDA